MQPPPERGVLRVSAGVAALALRDGHLFHAPGVFVRQTARGLVAEPRAGARTDAANAGAPLTSVHPLAVPIARIESMHACAIVVVPPAYALPWLAPNARVLLGGTSSLVFLRPRVVAAPQTAAALCALPPAMPPPVVAPALAELHLRMQRNSFVGAEVGALCVRHAHLDVANAARIQRLDVCNAEVVLGGPGCAAGLVVHERADVPRIHGTHRRAGAGAAAQGAASGYRVVVGERLSTTRGVLVLERADGAPWRASDSECRTRALGRHTVSTDCTLHHAETRSAAAPRILERPVLPAHVAPHRVILPRLVRPPAPAVPAPVRSHGGGAGPDQRGVVMMSWADMFSAIGPSARVRIADHHFSSAGGGAGPAQRGGGGGAPVLGLPSVAVLGKRRAFDVTAVEAAGLEDSECSICTDAEINTVIVPCGHASMCRGCALALQRANDARCPTCRAPIASVVPLHVQDAGAKRARVAAPTTTTAAPATTTTTTAAAPATTTTTTAAASTTTTTTAAPGKAPTASPPPPTGLRDGMSDDELARLLAGTE